MKTQTVERGFAKINLTLHNVGVRPDGYHEIRSVMHTVDLCDTVTLTVRESGIRLTLSDPTLPTDEKNTAFAAAKRFLELPGCPIGGVELYVEKRIPQQAGLAGGSADAAAVLRGLNRLCGEWLSADELCVLGVKIGADVPFCVRGGAALCSGIGEKMETVPTLPEQTFVVVCKPPVGVSTKAAYAAVDAALATPDADAACEAAVLRGLQDGDLHQIGQHLSNVFERALALPEVAATVAAAKAFAPCGVRMSGSGSAVYALFDSEAAADVCAKALAPCGEAVVCRPTGTLL